MAMAVRVLARQAIGRTRQSLSTPSLSAGSSPAVGLIDESLLVRCFSSLYTANPCSSPTVEVAKLKGLPQLSLTQSSRIYSTEVVEGGSEEEKHPAQEKAEPIRPPPRPFRLTSTFRTLAEEIGYKVIDRYTEKDFGRNKKPKAFAVVQIGSHQFKVSPNDIIYTEKLKYCDINDKLMLSKVLLLGSKTETIVGRPIVPKSAVFAVVEEHALDEKVIIFKKKRRKNYRRTTGHRQELTRLRILDIKGIEMQTTPSTPSIKIEKTSQLKVESSSEIPAKIETAMPVLA